MIQRQHINGIFTIQMDLGQRCVEMGLDVLLD